MNEEKLKREDQIARQRHQQTLQQQQEAYERERQLNMRAVQEQEAVRNASTDASIPSQSHGHCHATAKSCTRSSIHRLRGVGVVTCALPDCDNVTTPRILHRTPFTTLQTTMDDV